jgi:3-isopropylmalate/(R)-2-methylmalate dehydratase small subunit|tara:strand:+ start:448 stop:948 length:501 start_codon:yes stop_codon:yes gene_type:complete
LIVDANVLKYGDDINTDLIIPGKYLVITDEKRLGQHAMDGIDPDFYNKSRNGSILVVGENFGSGSSREQAPISLKNAGVKCIVAKSFARIFYRNAINIGLPVLECLDLWNEVREGDALSVNLNEGKITNKRTTGIFQANPLPPFILDIIQHGGLLNKLKDSLNSKK